MVSVAETGAKEKGSGSVPARSWIATDVDEAPIQALVREAGYTHWMAKLLVARGVTTQAEAEAYLTPSLKSLPDPALMLDLTKAAERLADAIEAGQRIALYGDYDVDGVTSTSVLSSFLAEHGVKCRPYIPKRLVEGYGLNKEAVELLAREGTDLLITLDCGITAADEIRRARELGIESIVVDHHKCPPELPPAYAVLNPQQSDCAYPDKGLAAVGVCFNLVVGTRRVLRERGAYETRPEPNLKRLLDLVALGTICDMVPLGGVNRILAWFGVHELRAARRPGIRALMRVSGVKAARCSSSDVGFRLGPRINAAGRLDDASVGVKLLLAEDIKSADPHAQTLDLANRERQRIEAQVFAQAVERIESKPELPPAIVLFDPEWHPGVIGIVASKLVERYLKPVILIGEGGRGSARTAGAINIYEAIKSTDDLLRKFGGHAAAAGLTIESDKVDRFRANLEKAVLADKASADDTLALVYDDELDPYDVLPDRVSALERLGPFGMGNPEPLFLLSGVRVQSSRIVGRGHLKFRIQEGPAGGLEAIAFQKGDLEPDMYPGRVIDLAAHVERNEYAGLMYLGLRVRDLR